MFYPGSISFPLRREAVTPRGRGVTPVSGRLPLRGGRVAPRREGFSPKRKRLALRSEGLPPKRECSPPKRNRGMENGAESGAVRGLEIGITKGWGFPFLIYPPMRGGNGGQNSQHR